MALLLNPLPQTELVLCGAEKLRLLFGMLKALAKQVSEGPMLSRVTPLSLLVRFANLHRTVLAKPCPVVVMSPLAF